MISRFRFKSKVKRPELTLFWVPVRKLIALLKCYWIYHLREVLPRKNWPFRWHDPYFPQRWGRYDCSPTPTMVQMIIKMMSKLALRLFSSRNRFCDIWKNIPLVNVRTVSTWISPFNTEVGYWWGNGVKIFAVAKVCPFVAKISSDEERHKDDLWQRKPPK